MIRFAAAVLLVAAVARAEESAAESLRQFAYEPAEFAAKLEERMKRDAWTHWKVTFPSSVKSAQACNDTVHGHLVEPAAWSSKAAVIILPIWKGGGPDLEMMVARRLASDGIAAFVMALPWQFERAPEGRRSGDLTVSADLELTRASVAQAVVDVRRSMQFLVDRRGADPAKLGLMGISLGGHVAALTWAIEPRFKAGCCVLAGGNIHELFWNESNETKEIKEALVARGVTLEQLREMMKPYDAVTYATKKRGEGLLLIAAKDDPVVPVRNARALRDAFRAPLIVLPGNHYTVALQMPVVLDDVSRHFRASLTPD